MFRQGPRSSGAAASLALMLVLGVVVSASGLSTSGLPVEKVVFTGDNTTAGVVHEGEYFEIWYSVNVNTYPTDPYDIHLILDILHGDADLLIKGPDFFKRTSTHATGSDVLFVSRDTIADLCTDAVICMFRIQIIGHAPITDFEVAFDIEKEERVIHPDEQEVLESIYTECCIHSPLHVACDLWKTAVEASETAEPLANFCHLPGQVCNSDGRLTHLDLRWSYLECPIPTSKLSKLVKLERLLLHENDLSGTFKSIQSLIKAIPGLKHVHMRDNKISGPLACCPAGEWGCMNHLKTLDLEGNDLEGGVPECLLALPNIGVLSLKDNKLDGTLPDEMPYTSSVAVLDLSSQRGGGMSGALPDFSPLETLMVLRMGGNSFSGPVPAVPFDLEDLDFSHSHLDGDLHPSLRLLKRLRSLDLSHNHLTGTIHKELALATPNLELIDLSSNALTGEVPVEWESDILAEINLASNFLTGPVPGRIATWDGLKILNLANNSLSGSLHDFAAHMKTTHIRQLLLAENKLTGSLPEGLTMVEAISLRQNYGETLDQVLDLSFNLFAGSFPEFLMGALVRLQATRPFSFTVDLQGNYIDCPSPATATQIKSDFPKLKDSICLDTETGNLRTFANVPVPPEVLLMLQMDSSRPDVTLADSAVGFPAPMPEPPTLKDTVALEAGLVQDEQAPDYPTTVTAYGLRDTSLTDDEDDHADGGSDPQATPAWVIVFAILLSLAILAAAVVIAMTVAKLRGYSGPFVLEPRAEGLYKEQIDASLDPGTNPAIEMA